MSAPETMSDVECEDLIGWADGRWHDSEYRIDARDLMSFVRHVAASRDAQWQARLDAALKEEREACAKLCEEEFSSGAIVIADIIRARPA